MNMATTTTKTKKTITITMSETAPVRIDPALWPVIASAETHDGKVECQANTEWVIKVREHADGRRLVYGSQSAGNGGQYAGYRGKDAGYLIDAPPRDAFGRDVATTSDGVTHDVNAATIRAIRRVAGVIGDEDLGAECVGDLPAQEIG